jgi:hypothetical protein
MIMLHLCLTFLCSCAGPGVGHLQHSMIVAQCESEASHLQVALHALKLVLRGDPCAGHSALATWQPLHASRPRWGIALLMCSCAAPRMPCSKSCPSCLMGSCSNNSTAGTQGLPVARWQTASLCFVATLLNVNVLPGACVCYKLHPTILA